MEETDLAYVAGVLDTRAVVKTRLAPGTETVLPHIMLSSGDAQLLQWLAQITAVRSIVTSRKYDKHRCLEHCTQAHDHITSVSGRWSLTGAKATVVLWGTRGHVRFHAEAWDRALQAGLTASRKPATVAKMKALGWPLPPGWTDGET